MLDEKICELRDKLNECVISGEDYEIVYDLSIKLDTLIAEYYSAVHQ